MPEAKKIKIDLSVHGFPPGFEANFEVMSNGETRYRFLAPDGTAYIRTAAGSDGAWQNAHHHAGEMETYVVYEGWMALATQGEMGRTVRIYEAGETVTTTPGVDHNVYLPAYALIGTEKHGTSIPNPAKSSGTDWYAADEEFDKWTKSLSRADITQLGG